MQISINNVGTLDGANIVEESMTLQESICSESQLLFGCCEASVFKIRLIAQSLSIVEKDITVSIPYDGQSFQLGKYKVFSDKPTADRKYRDIVAYDAMYDIINAEVSAWYNTVLPSAESTVTLKQFRTSFFDHMGILQEVVDLPNDSMTVTKTVEPTSLSGKTVITAICEINGCFGHIDRDGIFKYVFLEEITDSNNGLANQHYISAKYEDYTTEKINKLQIRQEENDVGCIYGTGENCYIVQDNFLLYGKSTNELQSIAANMYNVICNVAYRPATVEAKGNPSLEVGNAITVLASNVTIRTYILQRTLKGIQALRDTYQAEGEQCQSEKVNSVRESILQLKGKTNVLTRTIEETKLQITDLEKGLSNEIKMTADEFDLKIQELQSEIDGEIVVYNHDYEPLLTNYPACDWTYNIPVNNTVQLRDDLQFEYKEDYWKKHSRTLFFDESAGVTYRFEKKDGIWNWYPTGDTEYSYLMQQISEVKVNTENISANVSAVETNLKDNYLTKVETESKIEVTRQGIMQTVSADYITTSLADKTYETKAHAESTFKQTAEQISLKVSKNNIVSEINQTAETIKIQAQKIDLVGLVNANEFVSKYATIATLNATTANLQNLIAGKASISSLNSTNAEIEALKASKIDASTVKANYMEVANWTSSGYIKADKINVNTLLARTSIESSVAYLNGLHVRKLWDSDGMGLKIVWKYSSTLGAWYLSGVQSA